MWLTNWVEYFFPKERVINEDIHLTSPEKSINQLKNNVGKLKIAKKMLNALDIEKYNVLFNSLVVIDVQSNKDDVEYLLLSPFFDVVKNKESAPFYYPDINAEFTEVTWKKL